MTVLKVAKLGNPILRQTAKPLAPEKIRDDRDIQTLIDDMIETMRVEHGVGLAAPQVSHSLRIVVLECQGSERYPDKGGFPLMVLVNPVFTRRSRKVVEGWEGCLSLPDLRGLVTRSSEVDLEAYDRFGEPVVIKADGFLAIALQHEIDHLDGIVFLDRLSDLANLAYQEEFDVYWAEGASDSET
jgi:peptide deformylase